jgi:hypothetical protein
MNTLLAPLTVHFFSFAKKENRRLPDIWMIRVVKLFYKFSKILLTDFRGLSKSCGSIPKSIAANK